MIFFRFIFKFFDFANLFYPKIFLVAVYLRAMCVFPIKISNTMLKSIGVFLELLSLPRISFFKPIGKHDGIQ
jgi:hypothetical protein